MSEIEVRLHQLHEAARQEKQSTNPSGVGVVTPPLPAMEDNQGFARVDMVTPGSPAAVAVSTPRPHN